MSAALIGRNPSIGQNVDIYDNVYIGDNVRIGDGSVIGKPPFRRSGSVTTKDTDLGNLVIGDNVTIGAGCILCQGSKIHDEVYIGDNVNIRENSNVNYKSVIGAKTIVENEVSIGFAVRVQAGCYICPYTTIDHDVFIGPGVMMFNDNYLGRGEHRFKEMKGPRIESYVRVGGHSTLMPGCELLEDCLIGAGSIVIGVCEERCVYIGAPAKKKRQLKPEEMYNEK